MAQNKLTDRFPNGAYRAQRAVDFARSGAIWARALVAFGFCFTLGSLGLLTWNHFHPGDDLAGNIADDISGLGSIEVAVPSRVASRVDDRILLERQRYASRLNRELDRQQPTRRTSERPIDPTQSNAIEKSAVEIDIPDRPSEQATGAVAPLPLPVRKPKTVERRSTSETARRLAARKLEIDALTNPDGSGRKVELDGPRKITATAGETVDLPLAIIDPSGRSRDGQVIVGGLPAQATLDIGESTGSGTWRLPAADSDIAVIRIPRSTRSDFRLTLALRAPSIDPPLIRRVNVQVLPPQIALKPPKIRKPAKTSPKKNKGVAAISPKLPRVVTVEPDIQHITPLTADRITKAEPASASPATEPAKEVQPTTATQTLVTAPAQPIAPVENIERTMSDVPPIPEPRFSKQEQDARDAATLKAALQQDTQEDSNASSRTATPKKVDPPRPTRAKRPRREKRTAKVKPTKKRKNGGYGNLGWNPFNGN